MTTIRLSLLLAAAFSLGAQAAPAARPSAKNIIFFLGDGMGPTTITAARIFKAGEDGLLDFERFERTARIKTYSADAQVTDSAPSMGAYMTGVKINNDVISMQDATPRDPAKDANGNASVDRCGANNGSAPMTILELAKARGKAVGAITTTELTHATPASTFSHVCNRDMGYQIAQQIVPGGAGYNTRLGDGVDVLMGGGRNHFTPFDAKTNRKGRADGRDLMAEFAAQGYFVASTRADMASSRPGRKFVGVYSAESHLDYASKRRPEQPTLAEMTAKSIELLSPNPKGFFLMVEGGKIDHALHETNARNALVETVAFDEAIRTAVERMRALDPGLENTLIVVTADHDHTMVLNGYPKRGNPVLDIVRGYANGEPTRDADGKTFTTLVFGNGPNRPETRLDVDSAAALAEGYHQEAGVRWSSESHGGGDVKLYAEGAGSAPFKGTMENTRVFDLMKAAFGL
ncbi:alkaline phosphatase [Massilia sp. Dwa41.01b]|uniref:alkaline phosphatase n=1 Tax=unclassified Massilia TaxID=2609279 RepID=UPI001603157A|nr:MULTISPECIES: alkaline phosphatase [unclassified Massilia]QNA90432.1 alkaline phosphatase [Massilia sp. Dwa41.01b]QNA97660.1 alkaline phosphatase [Massilia sp. Se16.2.3]